MSHCIFAVVGETPLIAEIATQSGSPYVAKLTDNLSIVGLADQQIETLAGSDFEGCHVGFEHFNRKLQDRLAEATKGGALIYLETEYSGGEGSQAAAFLCGGALIWSRHETSEVPPTCNSPINAALRELGVMPKAGSDEFDTVGLSRFRSISAIGRN